MCSSSQIVGRIKQHMDSRIKVIQIKPCMKITTSEEVQFA